MTLWKNVSAAAFKKKGSSTIIPVFVHFGNKGTRDKSYFMMTSTAYMYYSTCRWLFCFLVDYLYIIHDFSFRFESEKGKKQFF